ncbi:MAG: DUF1232 domain-containing protein [Nitrospinaceae bacterium]
MKNLLVALIGFISLFYLINPAAGFIELIPDNLPLIGNLDEAAAAALFLAALRYFGVDLTGFLRKGLKDTDSGKDSAGPL